MMKTSFMKLLTSAIILLFIGIAYAPSITANNPISIKTIYVDDDDGADYTRIQDVLTNLISNNEIIVYNGTSFDNNIVRKKLNRLDIVESSNDFYQNGLINNKDGNSYDDELHFYGESNASIYIVTVESSSNITLVDGLYIITLRSNGTQTTTGSDYGGCWITDGTVLGGLGGVGSSEGVQVGELRFLRLKFGEIINYTYDNRDYQEYEHNQTMFGSTHWLHENYTDFTLPSGKWHFIFTALRFDLEQEDVLPNFKVWLNFSEECEDLEISTSEGGKIHGLCYAEYDANIIVSKSWAFEYMLNGKASFNIENTFIYEFILHPRANGFWDVKWNTPEGGKNFNMIMRNGKKYYNEDKVEGCVWGVGKNGHYEISTSYLDYDYVDFYTFTPYFIGLDVKLP